MERFTTPGATNVSKAGLCYRRVLKHAVVWHIWEERNKRIFKDTGCTVDKVWARIIESIWDWCFGREEVKEIRVEDLIFSWSRVTVL